MTPTSRRDTYDPATDTAQMRALMAIAQWQTARRDHDHREILRLERELECLGYIVRAVRPLPEEVADGREK